MIISENELMNNDYYSFSADELYWSLNNNDVAFAEIAQAIENKTEIKSISVDTQNISNYGDEIIIKYDNCEFAFSSICISIDYSEKKKAWMLKGSACGYINNSEYADYENSEHFEDLVRQVFEKYPELESVLADDTNSECEGTYGEKDYDTLEEALKSFNSMLLRILKYAECKAKLCSEILSLAEEEDLDF